MNKLIVFDMDGVLVDVSMSYRSATVLAPYIFLRECRNSSLLPDPLFSVEELSVLKELGGLNNDWDMTHRVISLLLSAAGTSGEKKEWDMAPLASFLKQTERPLTALCERGVMSDRADEYYTGDVGSGNIIKQIFQEIYLGAGLFEKTYGMRPEYYDGEGFILREKPFVTREILNRLSNKGKLAVATGRPLGEALFTLEINGFDMFSAVLSHDHCMAETERVFRETGKRYSFLKPSPFMLDEIVKQFGEENELIYVGDTGDDMRTAGNSAYPFKGVGVTYSAACAEEAGKRLRSCGADIIINRPEELGDL